VPSSASGAFELTFGLEESLLVKRVVVDEIARDEGRSEVVEVTEHLPVSELDDVKVELNKEKTTGGFTLDGMDGLVSWKLTLAPAEQRSVDLAFHVDVPSSYDTGGL
jgi:hypothetical protein